MFIPINRFQVKQNLYYWILAKQEKGIGKWLFVILFDNYFKIKAIEQGYL